MRNFTNEKKIILREFIYAHFLLKVKAKENLYVGIKRYLSLVWLDPTSVGKFQYC